MAPELPRSQAAGALKVIALQKPLQHSLTVFVLLGCVRGIELAVGPDGTLLADAFIDTRSTANLSIADRRLNPDSSSRSTAYRQQSNSPMPKQARKFRCEQAVDTCDTAG
jgi:hypothetical protein